MRAVPKKIQLRPKQRLPKNRYHPEFKKVLEAHGFLLPTELQWHTYKDGKAGEAGGEPRTFSNAPVSDEEMAGNFYAMPAGAKVDSAGMN